MDSTGDEETLAALGAYIYVIGQRRNKKTRKRKSVWVRNWISRRGELGAYNALLRELQLEDPRSLKNFLRMDMGNFNQLLDMVRPFIEKRCTPMRNSIPAGEKLALTLRYLASGDSYQSKTKNTICQFVPEVCDAITKVLHKDYVQVPNSESQWKIIREEFETKFPNCIGALDGKHFAVRTPCNSGSAYYNYKMFFSIILLALVDANCKFIFVDVGANVRAGDASVHALESNSLHLPSPSPLPGRQDPVPSVVVGDDAFTLKSYCPTLEKVIGKYKKEVILD